MLTGEELHASMRAMAAAHDLNDLQRAAVEALLTLIAERDAEWQKKIDAVSAMANLALATDSEKSRMVAVVEAARRFDKAWGPARLSIVNPHLHVMANHLRDALAALDREGEKDA
jgi:hypothetical protein